jgi:hypothetical protein
LNTSVEKRLNRLAELHAQDLFFKPGWRNRAISPATGKAFTVIGLPGFP